MYNFRSEIKSTTLFNRCVSNRKDIHLSRYLEKARPHSIKYVGVHKMKFVNSEYRIE